MAFKSGLILAAALLHGGAFAAHDPFDGNRLHDEIKIYVGKGDHLAGTTGASATSDWLADRLQHLGYGITRQKVPMRQYRLDHLKLEANGMPVPAALQWWPTTGRVKVKGRIGTGPGGVAIVPVEVRDQSYLTPALATAVANTAAAGTAAVLLRTTTSLGADGPYRFNARGDAKPWPLPVLSIGDVAAATLVDGTPIEITMRGRYEAINAVNIVARLDRPEADRVIVISTPYTGWGPCGGERGPGIALFLAIAEWARSALPYDIILVATAGHEIGHSGMTAFLGSPLAPPADRTALWLHLGASIATFARAGSDEPNRATRYVQFSPSLTAVARRNFADAFVPLDTGKIALGEMVEVKAAGYESHVGFAGYGPYHHLPGDDAGATGPAILADAGQRVRALLMAFESLPPS